MTVEVQPFAAGCGADISGVDIREPLSTADRDAIRKAWLDNLVLRFRGAPMTVKLLRSQYGLEKLNQIGGRDDLGAAFAD